MTDNEIICALDRLKYGSHTYFDSVTAKNTIDLINRQKAVNKLQAKEIVDLKIKVEQQKAEIERLHIEGLQINKTFMDFVNKQIAEAIKEFAEKLKQSAFDCDVSLGYGNGCYVKAVTTIEIDNLVKEMVGE